MDLANDSLEWINIIHIANPNIKRDFIFCQMANPKIIFISDEISGPQNPANRHTFQSARENSSFSPAETPDDPTKTNQTFFLIHCQAHLETTKTSIICFSWYKSNLILFSYYT